MIFGALAVYFYATRSDSNPSSPDHSSAPLQVTDLDKSIAVLPLDNLSPDPENAFFADGVQEDVLTNLSKVRELLVIGRTSTLQYRDTVKTLPQIAEELDVRYLVEGSVRRAANQVRVTIQLIDSKTGGHLWAENYDRTLDDIFAIQAEIAKEISKQLRAVLSPEELRQIENRPTENQEAYDLFLRARNPEITTRSEMALLMEQAVELDPQFYQAWAELAEYYIQYWNNSSLRQDDERYSKAQLTFENLKRLAPDSPEFLSVQSAFAYSKDDDIELAIDYYIQASLKGHIDSDMGYRHLQLGQLNEAQLYLEETVRKEPFASASNIRLFHLYTLKNMWDEAEAFVERNVELRSGREISYAQLSWQEKTSYLEFLKTKGRTRYSINVTKSSGFEDRRGQFLNALLSRDLKESLTYIEEYANNFSNLTGGRSNPPSLYGWRIGPKSLLSALINFELGDNNKALENAKEATSYLEKSVDGSHKIKPEYLAALAICYALDQDREKVEATIPKIRALTEDINWKFRARVDCEMKIAVAYLILGDHDKAIETLEAASEMDSPIFVGRELDLWFIFDRLRGNPRFDALLKD